MSDIAAVRPIFDGLLLFLFNVYISCRRDMRGSKGGTGDTDSPWEITSGYKTGSPSEKNTMMIKTYKIRC